MGKKAIVIGASSGIGHELAFILAKNGYTVGITGRRKDALEAMARLYPNALIAKGFDCTNTNALDTLKSLVQDLGGLDLLVLSSGTGDLNEDLEDGIIQRTNALNVVAFSKITSWAFKKFQEQRHGHLVAISSLGGLRGSRIAPSYNASKAYQINFLEGLRQKAKKLKLDVTVTDIRPGFVATDMAKGDGQFWVAPPQKAAVQIYSAIRGKKDRAYITKRWRFIAIIVKILPNWLYKRM